MPFPYITACNAVITQSLSYRLYIVPHCNAVCYHAIRVRKCTSEDCTSCRSTDRLAGIRILITDSFFSQTVQIRGFHLWIAVASDHVFSGRICHQKYQLFSHVTSSFNLMHYGLFCSSLHFSIVILNLYSIPFYVFCMDSSAFSCYIYLKKKKSG